MKFYSVIWVLSIMPPVVFQGTNAQILREFPNLFRGGRRPQEENNGNENQNNNQQQQASQQPTNNQLLAIQPIAPPLLDDLPNNYQNPANDFQQGFIQLSPDIWNQEEIRVQLFSSYESGDTSLYTFRQSPLDQPKPYFFYGTRVDGGDGDGSGMIDSISLVQTVVTHSRIPVVTGSVHVKGGLYQIRQLPSGDLVVDRRGTDSDFDEEIEIEDDDTSDWQKLPHHALRSSGAGKGVGALEVDFLGNDGGERRLALEGPAGNNMTGLELVSYSDHRLLQTADDGSQLDIMVIYSRNAMCAAARHPDNKCAASSANKATIEGIIDLAIKETNEAFAESGIPTKLRLVKLHYDDQYDDTAFQWPTVFSHFTGNNDGYLDYIHAMRDQYGADFVSFIVNSRGYCGSGHRPREPSPDRAFSMVRWDCATGHYTFTHELAHTFGCQHDRASTPTAEIQPGDFNFGYQWGPPGQKSNWFRTLMAYNCPDGGCQRILRFSNPSMLRQGIPLGTESENNARFIRERLQIYAKFRPSVLAVERQPVPQLAAPPPSTSTAVYPRNTQRLDTVPYPGSLIGAAGNMFEIFAKTDLKVTGFAVTPYAATTVVVEVYKLNEIGSFVGNEYLPDAWTLIGAATIETRENVPNPLPPGTIAPVEIRNDTTQSFYVTFQADTNYNRYSRASMFGAVSTENEDIQFKVGYTANYPFSYHPKAPRVFNGQVFYEVLLPGALLTTLARSRNDKTISADPGLETETKTFQTTFQSNNGYAGNLFTVQAKSDLIVETFDVNIGTTETGLELMIYTKFGDYSRQDVDPGSTWTEICSTTVDGQGESKPTHISASVMRSVAIKANERQSFYITLTVPQLKYTSALLDPNYLSNDDISLVASAGVQYPFAPYFDSRIWNGNIYYKSLGAGQADIQGRDTIVVYPDGQEVEAQDTWNIGAVAARPP